MIVCCCTGATDRDVRDGTERGRAAGRRCGGCQVKQPVCGWCGGPTPWKARLLGVNTCWACVDHYMMLGPAGERELKEEHKAELMRLKEAAMAHDCEPYQVDAYVLAGDGTDPPTLLEDLAPPSPDFCRHCGASIPHRNGEGRCEHCAQGELANARGRRW